MHELPSFAHPAPSSASRRPPTRPFLSVVLLSGGTREELGRALASIGGRCRSLDAEVIVVRSTAPGESSLLGSDHPGVMFLEAPAGCTDQVMRDLGMGHATGDIIALRMDGAVGDGRWLEAFDATVGEVAPVVADVEQVRSPVVDGGADVHEVEVPARASSLRERWEGSRRASAVRTALGGVASLLPPAVARDR